MDESNNIFQNVDEFVTNLDDLISRKASDEALTQVFDIVNEELVKLASLDILNLIGPRLKDRKSEQDGDVDEWHNLQSMLEYVVTISSPKEMLIGLLSLLEIARSDEFFKLIIRPLRTTFLRLPSQRGDTLLWALNGLHDYIERIPVPENLSDLDDDEKAISENSPELNRLETCVSAALNFCEPFISEAKQCKLISTNEKRQEQILAIATFLLKLVERPVSYFDIQSRNQSIKSNAFRYECAQRLIRMLFDLKENFLFNAIDWYEMGRLSLICRFTEVDDDDAAKKLSKLVDARSIGVLASLIYDQNMCLERLPQVYNNEFIFEKLLPYANRLLKQDRNSPFIRLGIDLLDSLARRLRFQLGHDRPNAKMQFWESARLNDRSYRELYLNLINVMTYSKSEFTRRSALGLFTRFMGFFEPHGEMLVIRFVFYIFENQDKKDENGDDETTTTTSQYYFANKGILGYLIDYYRAHLNDELLHSTTVDPPFYRNIARMLALFTRLDGREETDFLDNFDRYMGALNLVRFLCMTRLNRRNTSVPISIFDRLSKNFVEPMRKGLEISKAHYELDIKNLKDDQSATVVAMLAKGIAGEKIPVDGDKMHVLESAVNSFDLMMSLVARVVELLDLCSK